MLKFGRVESLRMRSATHEWPALYSLDHLMIRIRELTAIYCKDGQVKRWGQIMTGETESIRMLGIAMAVRVQVVIERIPNTRDRAYTTLWDFQ